MEDVHISMTFITIEGEVTPQISQQDHENSFPKDRALSINDSVTFVLY